MGDGLLYGQWQMDSPVHHPRVSPSNVSRGPALRSDGCLLAIGHVLFRILLLVFLCYLAWCRTRFSKLITRVIYYIAYCTKIISSVCYVLVLAHVSLYRASGNYPKKGQRVSLGLTIHWLWEMIERFPQHHDLSLKIYERSFERLCKERTFCMCVCVCANVTTFMSAELCVPYIKNKHINT